VNERERLLLEIADDELVIGWRNSEWTGIAPMLEEDVAFSSLAQNEIGHARAIYQLLSEDADALAFDRQPDEYLCSPLVQLRLVPDWAKTIARHVLYELADEVRLAMLKSDDDPDIRGLATKMDREEQYHRMHAAMWRDRLRASAEGSTRLDDALSELWPYAASLVGSEWTVPWHEVTQLDPPPVEPLPRDTHLEEWPALWEEMTMVRRSAPAGAQW
jgi:ring-1,2-phenylacetyl-CoA epoxidase subunit PaaC